MGITYANFTPSRSNVPALEKLSEDKGVPIAGEDGKTGQTLLKTVLAPAFRVRQLKVDGWYSTNILGNNDGRILHDPGSNKTKVTSKIGVLDSILGYEVADHQVHIHYYRPRGDDKEAWDNIDVLGFVGAGGLGQQLDNSTKMFAGGEVATMLLVFVLLVTLADKVSAWLRKVLA